MIVPHAGLDRNGRELPPVAARIDLADELSKRVDFNPSNLKKRIRCPLPDHEDRHPDFSFKRKASAYPDWHCQCFGCGWKGDAVDLLATLDGLSTAEWLRQAYERTEGWRRAFDNPQEPARVVKPLPPPPPWEPECDPQALLDYYAECHAALLHRPEGGAARRYLRDRGVNGDDVRALKLGVALPTSLFRHPEWAGRVLFPCISGPEGRDITGTSDRKYLNKNLVQPYKTAWLHDQVRADGDPVLIVEGVMDALLPRRFGIQAVALRGQRMHPDDARLLASKGVRSAYIGFDWAKDAGKGADRLAKTVERAEEAARTLAEHGITAHTVRGPARGDWGDLLTLDHTQQLTQLGLALRDFEGGDAQ